MLTFCFLDSVGPTPPPSHPLNLGIPLKTYSDMNVLYVPADSQAKHGREPCLGLGMDIKKTATVRLLQRMFLADFDAIIPTIQQQQQQNSSCQEMQFACRASLLSQHRLCVRQLCPSPVQGRHDAAEDRPTAFWTSVTSYHTRWGFFFLKKKTRLCSWRTWTIAVILMYFIYCIPNLPHTELRSRSC